MVATKKWVFFIPVIIGILVVVLLKQQQSKPLREPVSERSSLVRVLTVPRVDVIPTVLGYGTVRPAVIWDAVAQVKGKIIVKNTALEKGAIMGQGALLLQIDPVDYQLAIAQTEADLEATRAQLLELEAKETNSRLSLAIEQQALQLSKKELERQKKLIKDGSISHSAVEKQEKDLLVQQQIVQGQQNTLNLYPSQKSLLNAQLLRQQAQLESIRRDLTNTTIKLPFTGRIAAINVEQDQYVREGEVLATVDDLDKAEIEVQLPINLFKTLIYSQPVINLLKQSDTKLQETIGIKAEVILREGDMKIHWKAKFDRISDTLDPKSRTIGIIVEVDKPYNNVQPGVRPPLVKGLFVEVKLTGSPRKDRLVVPRSALHNDKLYIVTAENRLNIRKVEIEMNQKEFVVISSGLQQGEQVVLSDLSPAIENMLLVVQNDENSLQHLINQATNR